MRLAQLQPQCSIVCQGLTCCMCEHTLLLVDCQLNLAYFAKSHQAILWKLARKMFCLHCTTISTALCRCSEMKGVIWGPAVTHWEMIGGTALRVISPFSLGGPGLNHGRLANAMHRAILVRPRPMHVWLTGSSQNALTNILRIMVLSQQSPVKRQSKTLFSLAF